MRHFIFFDFLWIPFTVMISALMGRKALVHAFTARPSMRTSSTFSHSVHLFMSSTSSQPPSAPPQKRAKNIKVHSRSTTTSTGTKTAAAKITRADSATKGHQPPLMNLYTISKEELQDIIKMWGYPRYRADQIYNWIRERGVVDANQMDNIPKKLRNDLLKFSSAHSDDTIGHVSPVQTPGTKKHISSTGGALELVQEQVSPKDGTVKRLYRLRDGYLIESVLMPYDDGRWTSCISSQAGCAQGCVFCATGQMGFQRQLTSDEIVEQVTRFATHLRSAQPVQTQGSGKQKQHGKHQRLSNVVFMGEGMCHD